MMSVTFAVMRWLVSKVRSTRGRLHSAAFPDLDMSPCSGAAAKSSWGCQEVQQRLGAGAVGGQNRRHHCGHRCPLCSYRCRAYCTALHCLEHLAHSVLQKLCCSPLRHEPMQTESLHQPRHVRVVWALPMMARPVFCRIGPIHAISLPYTTVVIS